MTSKHEPHDQLIQAVRQDNPAGIQAAIQAGAALDRPQLVGLFETETPLEMALSLGHAKALAHLDQAGATWPDRVETLLRQGPFMGVIVAKTPEAQAKAKAQLNDVLTYVSEHQATWAPAMAAIREESDQVPAVEPKRSLLQRMRRRP